VFRIGSLTKTFTAIAVMQLCERGLVELDAPANAYLRSVRLAAAEASFRPVTVRHLLTHTAGIGYWRRLADLLQPGVGSGDRAGRSGAAPLADYYRKGLRVEVEPGTKWVYSNHGFAVLGQIVEDVTGQPLDRYLRECIFGPLGMEHTDLIRSERVRPRLATGYMLRPGGLKPIVDREVPTHGAGGMYSTPADMGRYLAALLRGGVGLRLHPDDPADPRVFRAELPEFGTSLRVAFSEASEHPVTPPRLLIDLISFQKRPDVRDPRRWAAGAAAVGAAAFAIRHRRASPRRAPDLVKYENPPESAILCR